MAEVSLTIDLDDAHAREQLDALNEELLRPRSIPVTAETTASTGDFGGGLTAIGSQVSKFKGLFGQIGGVIGDLNDAAAGSEQSLGRLASRLPSIVTQIGGVVKQLSKIGGSDQPAWLQIGTSIAGMFGPIGAAVSGLATTVYNLFTETDRQAEENAAAERERQAELNRMRQQAFEKQWAQYQQFNKQISEIQLGKILGEFNANNSPSTGAADRWERLQNLRMPAGLTSEERAVRQQTIRMQADSMRAGEITAQTNRLKYSPLASLSERNLPGLSDVLAAQARQTRLRSKRTNQDGGLGDADAEELSAIEERLQAWLRDSQNALKSIGIETVTDDLTNNIKQVEQAQQAYSKQLESLTTAYEKLVADGAENSERLHIAQKAAEDANDKRLNELLKESREDTPENRAAEIQAKAAERYNSLMRLGLGTDEASEATVGWLRNQNTKGKQVSTYSGTIASDLTSVGGGGMYRTAEIQTVSQSDSDRLLTKILSVLTTSKDLQAKFLEQDFDAGAILY